MVESQEPIWPNRIFIPIPVGDLSSVVHRRIATPENLQSADGPICINQPICFECGFIWEVIESVYETTPTQCPNCLAITGVSIADVQRFGRLDQ